MYVFSSAYYICFAVSNSGRNVPIPMRYRSMDTTVLRIRRRHKCPPRGDAGRIKLPPGQFGFAVGNLACFSVRDARANHKPGPGRERGVP
jgi:hypothetical protein